MKEKKVPMHILIPKEINDWYARFAKEQTIPVSKTAAITHVLSAFMHQEEKEFRNNPVIK